MVRSVIESLRAHRCIVTIRSTTILMQRRLIPDISLQFLNHAIVIIRVFLVIQLMFKWGRQVVVELQGFVSGRWQVVEGLLGDCEGERGGLDVSEQGFVV